MHSRTGLEWWRDKGMTVEQPYKGIDVCVSLCVYMAVCH